MRESRRAVAALAVLLLGGCDTLAGWVPERETVTGWLPAMPFDGAAGDAAGGLERVRLRADDTPGNQGLLYVALVEAEAAAQSAGRALAADSPAAVEGAMGDLLHALDPALAPDWNAKGSGIVPDWSGLGYGLEPALAGMIEAFETAGGTDAGTARAEILRQALLCSRNVQRWSEALRTEVLAAQGASGSPDPDALAAIESMATRLSRGRDADGSGTVDLREGECGLRQVAGLLRMLPRTPDAR